MAGRLFSPLLLLLLLLLVQVRRGEAQILLKGRCPKIDSMENFEPDRFLGAWHEVERYFVSYEHLAGICWVENYLFDPKRGYYTRLDWQDRLSGQILNIENGITFDPKEPGRLSYVVQRPSIPILRGEYLLLSTDYFYYALAWQCQDLPLGLGHTEILWLLSKMSSPTAKTVDRAKKVAYELGLNVDLLQRQDRSKCNNPSPAY